jgi:hypothetical protein
VVNVSAANVTLAGSVDAVCGLGISVYQDHDKIRVSIAGAEAKIDIAAVVRLRELLCFAAIDARLWELGRDNADNTDSAELEEYRRP